MREIRKDTSSKVKATISSLRRSIYDGLPKVAVTKGQQRLQKKHGSPYEFAVACVECVGEISVDEARRAIQKYQLEWEAAK